MEVTIWSMDAEVSATLEACTCVFLTTFCTLMLISCMCWYFFDGGGSLNAYFGRFISSTGNLIGAAETCPAESRVSADQLLQAVGHAKERVAESIALERGTTSTVRSPSATAMGNVGHLLEVGDHVVEGGG